MKRTKELSVAAVAVGLAALWAAPSAALDPTKCKAKINAKDGVILVEAKTVSGTLLWGPAAGKEIYALFDNTGDCFNPDPKKCQLGAVSTPEQLSPPEGCTVYLKDTGDSSTCSAYIKKCVPGRRPCPSDMVDGGGFCIDKYEATVWNSPTGVIKYGFGVLDDYPCTDNGQNCTNIFARSVVGVSPSANITWFQAQQACRNVGKRLATSGEWQQAVAGTPDGAPCRVSAGSAGQTGTVGCVSGAGAFDMVGNLDEWVEDWVPRSTACPGWGAFSNDYMCLSGASTTALGPGALLRGGRFNGLTLAGPLSVDVVFAPSDSIDFIGFRCAR